MNEGRRQPADDVQQGILAPVVAANDLDDGEEAESLGPQALRREVALLFDDVADGFRLLFILVDLFQLTLSIQLAVDCDDVTRFNFCIRYDA